MILWCFWCAVLTSSSTHGECSWDSRTGATFDLSALVRDFLPYTVTDGVLPCTVPQRGQNYTYIFNICRTIPKLPEGCNPDLGTPAHKNAYALQYDTIGLADDCKTLGVWNPGSETNKGWALLDPKNPSRGVSLTYNGGEQCSISRQKIVGPYLISPTARLNLVFRAKILKIPQPIAANERSYCHYEVTMPCQYGCPKECAIVDRKLCAGHGICEYDYSNKRAHCFCDKGYKGHDCATKGTNSSTATIYLLVILLIISASLIGVIGYMIRQVQAYRADATNYMSLHGTEMTELGDDDDA